MTLDDERDEERSCETRVKRNLNHDTNRERSGPDDEARVGVGEQ